MAVLSRANTSIHARPRGPVRILNSRCVAFAISKISKPEMANRTPANSILLPVWLAVMPNSANPSLMSG